MVSVEPISLLDEALITDARARSSSLVLRVIDSIPTPNYSLRSDLVCEPESRSKAVIVIVKRCSLVVICKLQSTRERTHSRDLKGRRGCQIEPANPVVPFGPRQIQVVSHADVQCQLIRGAPVVLNKTPDVPVLSGSCVIYFVSSPVARSSGTDHEAGHGVTTAVPGSLRCGVDIEGIRSSGDTWKENIHAVQAAFSTKLQF